MSKRYFISTAIPYVNADPHIGFTLELLQADTLARWQRLQGIETFFLTGTDENSLKNVLAAAKAEVPVNDFVDKHSKRFQELAQILGLSNDAFIRTTEPRHAAGAQKLWTACAKAGDIYKKSYVGLYCVGCEQFYTEKDLEKGLCPEHKTKPEKVEEENYFFRLSKYQNQITELLTSNTLKITPESRRSELTEFVKRGLEDISVSRSTQRARDWGVSVPGDVSQIMYVWFDALSNYINAIGFADDPALFKHWWLDNPQRVHLVGKGISRFHAIYWPAFLLSAGVPLPTEILIHGYVTAAGEKMSKSLGNVIDPFEVVRRYGADVMRYFLLREIPSSGDGDFTFAKLEERYNGDLAHNLGNLVSRVAKLIDTKLEGELMYNSAFMDTALETAIAEARADVTTAVTDFRLHEALARIWKLLSQANVYIDTHKPWAVADANAEIFLKTMTSSARLILEAATLLIPFMPETAERIAKTFRVSLPVTDWSKVKILIRADGPLFPKLTA